MSSQAAGKEPYIVGLTGGIATGKSTVSNYLRHLGARVIDADEVAHQVTLPGAEGFSKLVEAFGTDVVNPDGSLNRKKLGQIVFNNEEALSALNAIVHPLVISRICSMIEILARDSEDSGQAPFVILDVPLLFETGLDRICNEVWVVAVGPDTQIKRLMERDGYTREEALSRIRAQMPLEEKIRRAGKVIDNSGSRRATRKQVRDLFLGLERRLKG
jgi:dephospho-CoA kinase